MHMEQNDGLLLLKECVRDLQAPHLEVHLVVTLGEVHLLTILQNVSLNIFINFNYDQ